MFGLKLTSTLLVLSVALASFAAPMPVPTPPGVSPNPLLPSRLLTFLAGGG
jgi:hypothetical protein